MIQQKVNGDSNDLCESPTMQTELLLDESEFNLEDTPPNRMEYQSAVDLISTMDSYKNSNSNFDVAAVSNYHRQDWYDQDSNGSVCSTECSLYGDYKTTTCSDSSCCCDNCPAAAAASEFELYKDYHHQQPPTEYHHRDHHQTMLRCL